MLQPSVLALCLVLTTAVGAAEPDWSRVEVKVVPVAGGVSILTGQGGNIGVTSGKDGIFLIDDQFEPLLPKIRAALKTLGDGPIRFVVNTHVHGDHTGSNARLGESGAIIIAQENVRKRLRLERINPTTQERMPPRPPSAWPVVTYADGVTLFLNDDELEVVHLPRAHTDGDSVIRFRKANVVHMGDTFFNRSYPFIDEDSGGSLDGIIAAADRVLAMIDGQTKVIPGHGPVGTKADLQAYRDMLASIRDRVRALMADGKTLEQILAAKPAARWDAAWGHGLVTSDVFVGVVHRILSGPRPR